MKVNSVGSHPETGDDKLAVAVGLASEMERPISGELYFGGYAGLLPGDSYASAAKRSLRELAELEQLKQSRTACGGRSWGRVVHQDRRFLEEKS
jgi:hypothetical protein